MTDYLSGVAVASCPKCQGMMGGIGDIKKCAYCGHKSRPNYTNITKVLNETSLNVMYDISTKLGVLTFDIIDNVSNDGVLFRNGGQRPGLYSEFWRIKKGAGKKTIMEITESRSLLPHAIYPWPQAYALVDQLYEPNDLPS